MIKAQIHAGGRGKGTVCENPQQHGVELVKSRNQAASVANQLLGNHLVTIQTGPDGQVVRQVLVEEGCDIAHELYLGIVLDRSAKRPALMVSTEGGMDIEKVAAETPHLIHKTRFDPAVGTGELPSPQNLLSARLGQHQFEERHDRFIKSLCRLVIQLDCSLAGNQSARGDQATAKLLALDAKINFDDNALFRHPEIAELRDLSEEEPAELRAGGAGLSYVKLDGNIGCLVNGAGLAMATMDIIKHHGGEPANFLDVGGGAKVEQVTEAFRILLDDKNVKAVLVNIFRRNHALHDHRQCTAGLPTRQSALVCRWSYGSKVPKSTKGAALSPIVTSTSSPPATWQTPPKKWSLLPDRVESNKSPEP